MTVRELIKDLDKLPQDDLILVDIYTQDDIRTYINDLLDDGELSCMPNDKTVRAFIKILNDKHLKSGDAPTYDSIHDDIWKTFTNQGE